MALLHHYEADVGLSDYQADCEIVDYAGENHFGRWWKAGRSRRRVFAEMEKCPWKRKADEASRRAKAPGLAEHPTVVHHIDCIGNLDTRDSTTSSGLPRTARQQILTKWLLAVAHMVDLA
jgi:hypothetical protein